MRFSTFNAKAEGILSSDTKSFVPAWKAGQRCTILVSGVYEWPQPNQSGQPPYCITPTDGPILSLGGLRSEWGPTGDGTPQLTCAIVTTPANALMKSVPHHRCPVTTTVEQARALRTSSKDKAACLMIPASDDK